MRLSDLSIKNPVFAWMLMAALIVFGGLSFTRLGVGQMPDVDFPVVTVSVTWEGAAPEVLETDVVDVIEDVVMSVQSVRHVSSSSRQGQASISIEFELERDIDIALQEVQTKIAQAQRRLPNDIDPPVVTKTNPEDHPILWLSLSGERPIKDLIEYVEDHLKDQFQTVTGVGEIFLGGYVEQNLRVWLDPQKLAAHQLSVTDVIEAIQREHAEIPAGRIETQEREYSVRAMGEASSVEEFGNIVIPRRGGQPIYTPIYLKDVARIEDGLADVRRISRVLGQPAVGLGIIKQRGANSVTVARRVRARLEEVRGQVPEGMALGVNFDSTRFIEDSIRELTFMLVLSAALTSLVCWMFFGSWSATLNILLAIPTSIIGTFIGVHVLGFTLNTFTLLGLTLAIGIVVDDAIMVLENIVRYRERGSGQVEAAILGARQITFAALAASVAIVAIFLPVAFMRGVMGRFFYEFGMTISIAVMLSLLEALTLAPMRCAQFLQVGGRRTVIGRSFERGMRRLAVGYGRVLQGALRVRWLVLLGAGALFAASLTLLPLLRKEFVPAQDQSMFLVRIQTPVGSSLQFTNERFRQAEALAMSRPELRRYYGAIGGFGGGEVNTGMLFLTFTPHRERLVVPPHRRPLTQAELMTFFRAEMNKIPDVKAVIQDLSMRGLTARRGFPIEFTIRGSDWERLAAFNETIRGRMEATGLMQDVDTDYQVGMPEVRVRPNRVAAAERGVSVASIGETINAMIGGVRVGKYTRGSRRYDIRVRLEGEARASPEAIAALRVWNRHGELVQMADVIRVTERPTLLSITREDRERAIGVFANVAPGKSQAAALDAVSTIAAEVLPEGYRLVFSGSSQTFQESFQSLVFALWLGVVVAYMVLAAQFNSYLHPITVLLALPFSISGALLALWLGNQSLNIYSVIGVILLMGIVKKNSILLVEFTNQLRSHGRSAQAALVEACPIRLRPILMTALSTVAAAVPPALALGPGAETRIPMALTVIGGMVASTVLTLFVVPCAYLVLARFERAEYGRRLAAAEDALAAVEGSRAEDLGVSA